MLRHMENDDFLDAHRELKRVKDGPIPPPHALWRLGRWLAEKGHARKARLPLERFLDLYKSHQDRPRVMLDLARVLVQVGQRDKALKLKAEAEKLGAT